MLINLRQVNKVIRGKQAYVVMSDRSELEVTARRREEFLDVLGSL